MRNLRLATILTAAAATLAGSAAALADHGYGTWSPRQVASRDVVSLVSADLRRGTRLRAIHLDERGSPRLILERDDGRRTAQTAVTVLAVAGQAQPFERLARDVQNLRFEGRRVAFDVVTTRGTLACTVNAAGARAFEAHCRPDRPAAWRPAPPPIPTRPTAPAPRPWAAEPSVIQACSAAVIGSKAESECMDATTRAVVDPRPAITACADAMIGNTNTLACIKTALNAPLEPSAHVAACADAMIGDASTLQCIGAVVRQPYDLTGTIRACDEAMIGNAATLACIQRATIL